MGDLSHLPVTRAFRARVLAATNALKDLEGKPAQAMVSHTQSLAMLDILRREKALLTPAGRADVAAVFARMAWRGEDAECGESVGCAGSGESAERLWDSTDCWVWRECGLQEVRGWFGEDVSC